MFDRVRNLENFLNSLHDAVYVVEKNREIVFWNKAAEELSGYSMDEIKEDEYPEEKLQFVDEGGRVLCKEGFLDDNNLMEARSCPITGVMMDGEIRELELYLHHKKGHRIPVFLRVIPFYDEDGSIIGAVEIFGERSERRYILDKLKKLEKLAMLDELTGLPNRRYIENYMKIKLEEYKINKNTFGIAFLDLDYFKKVNDIYGHDIGDLLLRTVSDTFSNNLKGSDLIGRWGGEEFLGVFSEVDVAALEKITERLKTLIKKTYIKKDGEKISTTLSIGATILKENESIEEAIKRADELLYKSKKDGRNRVTLG